MKRVFARLLLVFDLFLSGALFLAAAPEGAGQTVELPILMYHHIHSSPDRWGAYVISPETFENDLRYLKELGYESVSLSELLAFSKGEGTLPEKPILISFDDGHKSFQTYALPLLEKYDMSAVVAVVGAYTEAYSQTSDHNVSYAYLSYEELRELAASPHVEIISHSYALHDTKGRLGCKILPGESREVYEALLKEDIRLQGEGFQRELGFLPVAFAYPFGAGCPEAKEILKEAGFEVLFTCTEKVNRLTGDPAELLSLGRFNRPHGLSSWEMMEKFR